ncbi:MAG: ACT domain-containing protein [Ruminococcaceae bacterium]|nr:ACT domain-containing protein [Oscillospiraceae bacterium]
MVNSLGVKYYLIDSSILPEVYSKVIKAKNLLLSQEAKSVSEAVRMAEISRSAYYKYKDSIFEYNAQGEETASIHARLEDNAGVLSSVVGELYQFGANILSVNQSEPVNSVANVSITVRLPEKEGISDEIIKKLSSLNGVKSANII